MLADAAAAATATTPTTSSPEAASQPASMQASPEAVPIAHPDPDLREAAWHYAEGEFAQAQAILSQKLGQPGLKHDAAEMLTTSLLEVYRCSGQQERFEALALEYAERFDRSPTEWFEVSHQTATGLDPGHPQSRQSVWICPQLLDQAAWAECLASNPTTDSISRIDWRAVRQIDSSLAASFSARLNLWCEQAMELHWLGLDALQTALQACKTQGIPALDARWWLIHLELLRLTQKQNVFEDMALDYCVVFEVSPPSWSLPRCTLVQGPIAPAQLAGEAAELADKLQDTTISRTAYVSCELAGNVCADLLPIQLQNVSGTAGQITVSCTQLGRIDSSAGKALLNWLIKCQSKGCEIHFVRLPRLVQVHLQSLGMQNYAHLSTSNH
jgi:ABC-type transporter Mla MlaB component